MVLPKLGSLRSKREIGTSLSEINVTPFIDRMLADWYAPAERDVVLQGLPQLDIRAQAEGGASFVALPAARRVALLEALDGEVTALPAVRRLFLFVELRSIHFLLRFFW